MEIGLFNWTCRVPLLVLLVCGRLPNYRRRRAKPGHMMAVDVVVVVVVVAGVDGRGRVAHVGITIGGILCAAVGAEAVRLHRLYLAAAAAVLAQLADNEVAAAVIPEDRALAAAVLASLDSIAAAVAVTGFLPCCCCCCCCRRSRR